ncbi:MAG: MFS transporter [Bacillus sp. (in: Bacteria)]|nr:MFS transporter [Bacillus sp. (in: firmicutes)]
MGKIYQAWKGERGYRRLFWAGTVNGIGNRFTQVAVFALLYEITGSGMAIGFVLAIRMLPFLILAPIGGMLADKFSKKRILITIDLLRIPAVLSLLFVQGADQVWLVYILSFFTCSWRSLLRTCENILYSCSGQTGKAYSY